MYSFEDTNEKAFFCPPYGSGKTPVTITRIIKQNGVIIGIQAIDTDGYDVFGTPDRFYNM